ncbi:hypothetical protein [Caballeronia telluris]|uniref:Uncharacterized protein n=1 Tax=Caballeronia telluris TaxID=326475 RepID=A0A158KCN9_9BURK|nr:hypothetical protein [Caballeronia telluris]SAL78847.1 hypothetical protein AWB66_05928 [Caballeronia telluris]
MVQRSSVYVVRLESVWSHEAGRAGYVGLALKALCALADEIGASLVLNVHQLLYGEMEGESDAEADRLDALDTDAMDNDALEAWYSGHGFVRVPGTDDRNPDMTRTVEDRVLEGAYRSCKSNSEPEAVLYCFMDVFRKRYGS